MFKLHVLEENDFPGVISVSTDIDSSKESIPLKVEEKAFGKKKKRRISCSIKNSDYEAINYDNFSKKNDLFSYAIGYLDETTNTIKIQPTETIYILRNVFFDPEIKQSVNSTLTYAEKRESLTNEFGSKKKQRALRASQSNVILAENVSGAKAVENALYSQVEDDEDESKDVDQTGLSLMENRSKLLPLFNKDTSELFEVYPLSSLIPAAVQTSLDEYFDSLTSRDNEDESESTDIHSVIKHTEKVLLNLFQSKQQMFAAQCLEGIVLLLHSNSVKTIKKTKLKLKTIATQIIYLYFNINLYMIFNSGGRMLNNVKKETIMDGIGDSIPMPVLKFLTDSFTRIKKQQKSLAYNMEKINK
jgi:hypothetical protein